MDISKEEWDAMIAAGHIKYTVKLNGPIPGRTWPDEELLTVSINSFIEAYGKEWSVIGSCAEHPWWFVMEAWKNEQKP
jgi:hypothetical protein